MSCLFCRIVRGEIPAAVRYEDDSVIAFDDIHPQAPTHVLVIPKVHVARLGDCVGEHDALCGTLLLVARRVAADAGIAELGYRVVVNNGPDGGQEVDHLHFHVLGGRRLGAIA